MGDTLHCGVKTLCTGSLTLGDWSWECQYGTSSGTPCHQPNWWDGRHHWHPTPNIAHYMIPTTPWQLCRHIIISHFHYTENIHRMATGQWPWWQVTTPKQCLRMNNCVVRLWQEIGLVFGVCYQVSSAEVSSCHNNLPSNQLTNSRPAYLKLLFWDLFLKMFGVVTSDALRLF